MGPTQRKLADLQNSIDDIASCLKIFENRIADLEKKDIPGAKTFKGTIPPQQLDTTEVVKAICYSFKCVDKKIKDAGQREQAVFIHLSCKIEAIKVVRTLTNLGLLPSKELVDKYWEAST